jgi:glutathione synthase/RimK-type ligase-like ATP-grasp enzyme
MQNYKLGILRSFKSLQPLVDQYKAACEELKIDYVEIDLFSQNWINDLRKSNIDGLLVRVKGNLQEHKSLFDERLYIIEEELGIPIYPSKKELFLYENKRMYEYWLTANGFPHPQTRIFYVKDRAIGFIKKTKYPLVFKTNGGASSSGVTIINNKFQAIIYIHQVFGFFDTRLSYGKVPFRKGLLPIPKFGMVQRNYLIVQEFIPIKWEWRIIKIGNSYFGHQKLLKGKFASGSGRVGWVAPPRVLLDMIRELCHKGKFDSMAMDVFESLEGEYYINEIQSLFGSFLPYQMKINGKPGRYIYNDGDYIFEEGEFNRLGSNLLRVNDFVKKLTNGYNTSNI